MENRRRALVLTDESARHPFLRSLPPHVRKLASPASPLRGEWRVTSTDCRDFLCTWCAAFVAMSVYIT
jgi:hypothetical protein